MARSTRACSKTERKLMLWQKLITCCVLSLLAGCASFNALNGGMQVTPLPEDVELVLKQKDDNLCYSAGSESRCFSSARISSLKTYERIDKYKTYMKIDCGRVDRQVTFCNIYSQISGPLGGSNILTDKRRGWSTPTCYWLYQFGGLRSCEEGKEYAAKYNEIERAKALQDRENARLSMEEKQRLVAQKRAEFKNNPRVGDKVYMLVDSRHAYGMIVEIKHPLALVQFDNFQVNGQATRWVDLGLLDVNAY